MPQQNIAEEPKKTAEDIARETQVEVIRQRMVQSPEMKAALQAYAQTRAKAILFEREMDKAYAEPEKLQAAMQAEWEAKKSKEQGYKTSAHRDKFIRKFKRETDGEVGIITIRTIFSKDPLPHQTMLSTEEAERLTTLRNESQLASLQLLNTMRATLRDKEKMFTQEKPDGVVSFAKDERFNDSAARELFRATHRVLEKELLAQGEALTQALTTQAGITSQIGTTVPFAKTIENKAAGR